ncbi:hypothetical protein NB603_18445 [Vibrio antiquarius]|nr:hypothetical protein [Vibrio antiquarius]MCS0028062.1 hypothetical protein [Vibrio alginolyticus]
MAFSVCVGSSDSGAVR